MILVVEIVLWAVLFVAGLVLLALVTPLRLEMRLSRDEALQFSAVLRPFGRFGPRIPLSGGSEKSGSKNKPRHGKQPGRRLRKAQPKRLAQAALRLFVEVIGRVRIEAAALDVRFGLGDPGDTGQVFGQLFPLLNAIPATRRVRLNVEPVFDQAMLKGRVSLDLSLVPFRLVKPFVRFGWTAFGPQR